MKNKCGILIDSSCTYDEDFIRKNDIEIIPLSLSDANNKVYDDDGINLTREELLTRLDNGEVFKTSATPLGKLMMKVEGMLERYESVIYLPISVGISSQYQQSLIVQQEHLNRFFVVKATQGAIANEFVLNHMVDMVNSGIDPKIIAVEAEKLFAKCNTYFSIEDLSGLATSGRATKAIMHVIKFLRLKPIVQLDNKNQYAGIGKYYKNILPKIIKNIKSDYTQPLTTEHIRNVGIYYSGYDIQKKNFILETISVGFNFAKEKILIRWLPNSVLIHTRRGAYGLTVETTIDRKFKKYKN